MKDSMIFYPAIDPPSPNLNFQMMRARCAQCGQRYSTKARTIRGAILRATVSCGCPPRQMS